MACQSTRIVDVMVGEGREGGGSDVIRVRAREGNTS